MKRFAIVIDAKRCISCHACVAHCKVKNALPEGVFLSRLEITGPFIEDGKCIMTSRFQACQQCSNAPCMDACHAHAMHRDEDGVVIIDVTTCIGCGLCIKACPWHMPQIVKEPTRHAIKCDYCRDLRLQGLQPACVTACTAHALRYEAYDEQVFQVIFGG